MLVDHVDVHTSKTKSNCLGLSTSLNSESYCTSGLSDPPDHNSTLLCENRNMPDHGIVVCVRWSGMRWDENWSHSRVFLPKTYLKSKSLRFLQRPKHGYNLIKFLSRYIDSQLPSLASLVMSWSRCQLSTYSRVAVLYTTIDRLTVEVILRA